MRAFALLSLVFVFVFVFVFACHPQLPGLVRGLVWCGWDLACVFARAVRAAFVALGRGGVVGMGTVKGAVRFDGGNVGAVI